MSFKAFLSDNGGATAVEYGLIAAMCVMGTIYGLNAMGSALQSLLGIVSSVLASVAPG